MLWFDGNIFVINLAITQRFILVIKALLLHFSLEFRGGPGDEPVMLKIASAYEAATHHRKLPPGFGPVKGEL